jgi:uncharacterized protein
VDLKYSLLMNEELIKLVTLQKFDKEINDINKHIKGSSDKLEEDRKRLAKAKEQLEEKNVSLKAKKLESEKIDSFITSSEDNYKSYNYQLMQIKDEKAYDSMKMQLENTRMEIEEKENQGIDILNEIEELEKTISLYTEKINAEDERIQGVQTEIDKEIKERSQEIEGIQSKRDEYAKQIDEKILKHYEKLLGLPDSKAIVELDGRSCTGCYSEATLEDIENIKLQNSVVTCNVCGRILYIPNVAGQSDN